MCSCGGEEDVPVERLTPGRDVRTCHKCGASEPKVMLRGKDAYCPPCFLLGVSHKFRAALGKEKALQATDTALVGDSGGPASQALVELLRESVFESERLLPVKATVVHVYQDFLFADADENRTWMWEVPRAFPTLVTSLGFVFKAKIPLAASSAEWLDVASSARLGEERLQAIFRSIISPTSKAYVLEKLKLLCLARIAHQLSTPKVFLARTQEKLAGTMLTTLTHGTGLALASLPRLHLRLWSLDFLQPLKDISDKEAALFCRHKALQLPSRPIAFSFPDSIHALTQDFLVGLNVNFPSTVPTVTRIGCKLKPDSSNPEDRCILCSGETSHSLPLCCGCDTTLDDMPTDNRDNFVGSLKGVRFACS